MAELDRFNDFQDGGVGHLGKWRHTSGFTFFRLSMFHLVCVQNFIRIRPYLPLLQLMIDFQDGGNDVIAISAARGRLGVSKMADSESLTPNY